MSLDSRNKLQGGIMNLKLVFRIYAGFGALFVILGLLSPDAMLESFGMTYNDEVGIMIQFVSMIQLMFAVVVWQLPDWLGDNLTKAGSTFMVLSLIPVALNIFHVMTDTLPATGAFFVENGVWVVFAGLFYFYSKKPA
tara:strand:- start:51 stop:464 length:414 start_codon:yes stop_codon:yes gene_type:complete